LTLNDLAIAWKNKTVFLIMFIPLFVFVSLKLVDRTASTAAKIRIGLIRAEPYAPVILKTVTSPGTPFSISYVANREEGTRKLREKSTDCLLVRSEQGQAGVVLVVLKKEAPLTLATVESFSTLQQAVEGKNRPWISEVTPLQTGGIQKQTLPTWILMVVLLVGFIIMPAQVAEEKEKKLLLALLQTPMRETEWLIAKVASGMTLILAAILFLHLLGRFEPDHLLSYSACIGAGSFCFSSFGVLLGFLCRSQASARTLGVIFYLPHLLPSALSDFSPQLTAIAPLLPSYELYEPLKAILLNEGTVSNMSLDVGYLLAFGLTALFLSYLLMKRRWLMQ